MFKRTLIYYDINTICKFWGIIPFYVFGSCFRNASIHSRFRPLFFSLPPPPPPFFFFFPSFFFIFFFFHFSFFHFFFFSSFLFHSLAFSFSFLSLLPPSDLFLVLLLLFLLLLLIRLLLTIVLCFFSPSYSSFPAGITDIVDSNVGGLRGLENC